jgi:hypothetical protein
MRPQTLQHLLDLWTGLAHGAGEDYCLARKW